MRGPIAVLHHKKVVSSLGILRTDAFLLCFHLNVCSLRHMEESLPETLNKSRSNEGEGSHL